MDFIFLQFSFNWKLGFFIPWDFFIIGKLNILSVLICIIELALYLLFGYRVFLLIGKFVNGKLLKLKFQKISKREILKKKNQFKTKL
jgi:hypothetical protein